MKINKIDTIHYKKQKLMKSREFYKIMVDFVEEDKRWKALKIGDIIYEQRCAGMGFEYIKMEITAINVDERLVMAKDVEGNHHDTLSGFLTEEEFNKL